MIIICRNPTTANFLPVGKMFPGYGVTNISKNGRFFTPFETYTHDDRKLFNRKKHNVGVEMKRIILFTVFCW